VNARCVKLPTTVPYASKLAAQLRHEKYHKHVLSRSSTKPFMSTSCSFHFETFPLRSFTLLILRRRTKRRISSQPEILTTPLMCLDRNGFLLMALPHHSLQTQSLHGLASIIYLQSTTSYSQKGQPEDIRRQDVSNVRMAFFVRSLTALLLQTHHHRYS
jgi:hypothetical protein